LSNRATKIQSGKIKNLAKGYYEQSRISFLSLRLLAELADRDIYWLPIDRPPPGKGFSALFLCLAIFADRTNYAIVNQPCHPFLKSSKPFCFTSRLARGLSKCDLLISITTSFLLQLKAAAWSYPAAMKTSPVIAHLLLHCIQLQKTSALRDSTNKAEHFAESAF
jgi:hypothetical protein